MEEKIKRLFWKIPNSELDILVELLEDLIIYDQKSKENEWTKSIFSDDINWINSLAVNVFSSLYFYDKQEELEYINDNKQILELTKFLWTKKIYWIWNLKWYTYGLFTPYKWKERNIQNGNKYMFRKKILMILKEEKLVYCYNNDLYESYISMQEDEQYKVIAEIYNITIDEAKNEYLNELYNPEDFKIITHIAFKIKEIKELYKIVNATFKKESIIRNWTLYFDRKQYKAIKWTDNERFLKFFAWKKKKTFFSIEKIFDYIDWNIGSEPKTERDRKRIHEIKKRVNKQIKAKIWILEFFSTWKWLDKGKICKNY